MEHRMISAAKAYMSIWNAGGEFRLDDVAAANIEVNYTHFPEPVLGIADWKAALRQTHEYFPDMTISLQEVLDCEEKVIVYWSYSATHKNGEIFGISDTGQEVEVKGISILEIDPSNEKVIREYGVVDNLALLSQLSELEIE